MSEELDEFWEEPIYQNSVTFRYFPLGASPQSAVFPVSTQVERLFGELTTANWQFEIEVLSTGHIHADCCNEHGQLASTLVPTATEELPKMLELLIERAHRRWVGLGRPEASSMTFGSDD